MITGDRYIVLPVSLVKSQISSEAFRLYCLIASYCWGHRNACWPSQRKLAQELGKTIRQVYNLTQELESAGWIRVEKGAGNKNVYRLVHGAVTPETPVETVDEAVLETSVETAVEETSVSQSSPASAKNLRKIEPPEESYKLAEELKQSVLAVMPGAKVPRTPAETRRWAVEIDRMIRLDGRSPSELETIIRNLPCESFWSTVILSPISLRKHYDRIKAALARKISLEALSARESIFKRLEEEDECLLNDCR